MNRVKKQLENIILTITMIFVFSIFGCSMEEPGPGKFPLTLSFDAGPGPYSTGGLKDITVNEGKSIVMPSIDADHWPPDKMFDGWYTYPDLYKKDESGWWQTSGDYFYSGQSVTFGNDAGEFFSMNGTARLRARWR